LLDASLGTLPAVSFIDPKFTVADLGEGNDDHPHADIRAGDAFLAQTFFALANGPLWERSLFVVTYDEWGGFYDHVLPPRATAPNLVDTDIVNGKTLLGFRIPVCVASPYSFSKRGLDEGAVPQPRVANAVFDHTSVLKFIEWRWQLPPLTPRDASGDINNLARALDFNHPNFSVPQLPQPTPPPAVPCGQPDFAGPALRVTESDEEGWSGLIGSGLLDSWNLKLP